MLSNERFAGFNPHPKLDGSHAFLSPSTPSWIRYTKEKLIERLSTAEAAARGSRLHDTAERNIRDGLRMDPNGRYPVLAAYVNDAIDFEMTPEQMLFYSIHCYGTADTIAFDEEELFLRIHDLKTGVSRAPESVSNTHVDQLYVYSALFCLEYDYLPFEIQGELRIYKSVVTCIEIDRSYLASVYDTIKTSVITIEERRMGGLV